MKKILNGLKKFVCNFWVQISFFALCIAGILVLRFVPKAEGSVWETIDNFIANSSVMSAILVAAGTLILARLLFRYKIFTEESLKTEPDHHKIVCKYNKYSTAILDQSADFFSLDGISMSLFNVVKGGKKPENPYKDDYSDEYKARQKDIEYFLNGRLFLPSVSVFANILGDTTLKFDDSTDYVPLPEFMNENVIDLLKAHETSNFSNNVTVRLDDLEYSDNVLTLKTHRSQYFDMLITNRCMDYKLSGGVTLREMFESNSTVSKLKDSKLGNQIGINGLIFTEDGYVLLEKRGRKKTVWKNKFAQPISLALKEKDLKDGKIGKEFSDAEENLRRVILKTINKNFGLTENEINGFTLKNNFLGIARDLLEGGKPNMYFYVIVNMTAEELSAFLEDKMRRASECGNKPTQEKNLPSVSLDKLDSAFYLVKYDDIFVDYDYTATLKARDVIRIKRKFYPRVSRADERAEGAKYRKLKARDGSIKRECGEALLACMYYANVCSDRIKRELDGVNK